MDVGALIDGASILITGGTGFLGQALLAEIMRYHPARVVILSRSEAKQAEMKRTWPEDGPVRYFIRDVRDKAGLLDALEGVQIVIHAAALKRVEVCERDTKEAFLTNVQGTVNVMEAARERGAQRVLFVSSDKACSAATTYGATKYCAERFTIGMNNYAGQRTIRYACVRYGNVLGSTGSVLHTFQAANGSVPITHPDMTRFFWTGADAARFCLSSLALMRGGEVFVPKLPAMRIVDMALALAPQAKLEFIGLRGQEKIAEAMVSADESPFTVELSDRFAILPAMPFWAGASWPEAKPVPEGWSYTSARPERWLSAEELRGMVDVV